MTAYRAALDQACPTQIGASRTKPGSIDALIVEYFKSDAALVLAGAVSPATGQKISDFNDRFVGTHQPASPSISSIAVALTVPALTTLVSFNGTNGAVPEGSLIADAHGDLFGTTLVGGANNVGTVFEIAKTSHGYASTPTTLVSFNGTNGTVPHGSLIADAHGNLFGTTGQGGSNNFGTVFEIAKTAHGYASTPTTLVSFNFTNGADPIGSLIADAHGDLFGTTHEGGPLEGGLGRRRHGVRDCQDFPWLRQHSQHLVSFPQNGATLGAFPGAGSLIADSHGDLFGTTQVGGANNFGTVFEIAKTAHGYASTPTTTLVSFKARTVPIRTVA